MQKIGIIGIGKLGFPVSVGIAQKGYTINAFDMDRKIIEQYKKGVVHLYEPNIEKQFNEIKDRIHFKDSISEVVKESEIIFVAVQTPHPKELDGSVRFNHVRKDFDYSYLVTATKEIGHALNEVDSYKVISIISTVLPGTTRTKIYPAMKKIVKKPIGKEWGLVYNPSFIAMGTTIHDFTHPEFTLIGQNLEIGDSKKAGGVITKFYDSIHNAPKLRMTWDEAELVKMSYNTFIGFKIVFANTIMEICAKQSNANATVVTNALMLAKDRLISPKYLKPGMGDSGGCHPRDNLALSYLSDKIGLKYNLFDFVMTTREKQTEFLADLLEEHSYIGIDNNPLEKNKQIVILGKTYKPNTNLTDGSCSILLANILKERGIKPIIHDPVVAPDVKLPEEPAVYLLATPWEDYKKWQFKKEDVVIDPWNIIKKQEGVTVIKVGGSNI